jgi:hypothetical protein
MRDLDQLADSLFRAKRELAIAVANNDRRVIDTLRAAVRQLELMIAAASVDYHHREGC